MRIVAGIDFISQGQVRQVIDVDAISQRHRNRIPSELDRQDRLSERQFANGLLDVIVPDQHDVGRSLGGDTSPHHGQQIAPKEHFSVSQTSPDVTGNGTLEGTQIEKGKARLRANGEAGAVLVERGAEHGRCRGSRKSAGKPRRGGSSGSWLGRFVIHVLHHYCRRWDGLGSLYLQS
jgi:hypothetical protein